MAAALFGGVFAIGLAAAFFRGEAEMSTLALGLCGGCLVSGVLFAPYFRRSAAQSLGDFLARRFGGKAVPALGGIVAVAALFPMLLAELSVAGMVGNWTLGMGTSTSVAIAAVLMLAPPLLGGMHGLTVTGVLQFVLMLAGLVFTSIWMSVSTTGHMLPLAGYIAASASLDTIKASGYGLLSRAPPWGLAGMGLCVALGIAVFPSLLQRSAAARSTSSARSSIAWALLFLALFSVASASMSAVAKWIVVESPARAGSIAELVSQPWVVDWIAHGETLVTLCGEPASQAGIACTAPLQPGDLAIEPEIALLAAPQIAGAPPLIAMLVSVGCLVAVIAGGSLLIFAIGRALGHDVISRLVMPGASASGRLLVERLALVLATVLAVYAADHPPADYFRLMLISLSISASGLFPALLVGIWWPRANRFGALAGMLAGFATAGCLAIGNLYSPGLFAPLERAGLADLASIGIDRAALLAVPVALLAAFLATLATPRPKPAQRAFAEALLAPRDMPGDEG
jgi:cation/acetate symporter